MSFNLYSGNRIEVIAKDILSNKLRNYPLQDPFEKETIVVQNQGMAIWLKQEIAKNAGIFANIEFPFLKNFIYEIFNKVLPQDNLPDQEYFSIDVLTWKIFDFLVNSSNAFLNEQILNYIKVSAESFDNRELRILQLSNQLASIFDQYQIYRPEMLLSWESGSFFKNNEEMWQQKIWNSVSANKTSPSEAFKSFFELNYIPIYKKRFSVFAITYMPPIYLDFFRHLGESSDMTVDFYYLNPCREEWEFTVSEKEENKLISSLIQKKNFNNITQYETGGNKLLGNFGKIGREFFGSVLNISEGRMENCFNSPGRDELLPSIQSDVLTNTNPEATKANYRDLSIQINSCHSPMREVETLYDNLLNLIENYKNIQPYNIIVMTPDIEKYAPFIKAVFEKRNNEFKKEEESFENLLPYSISDTKISQNSKIFTSFLELLKINSTKFRITEILDILQTESIRKSFDIEENELDYIKKWAKESGMSWGIDKKHRKSMGLPDFEENTLTFGLDRILLGYAIKNEDIMFKNKILPYTEVELPNAELVGNFSRFMKEIFTLRNKLFGQNTIEAWLEILNEILDVFFYPDNESYEYIIYLRNLFEKLKENTSKANFNEKISVETLVYHIEEELNNEVQHHGFLRGNVTFCTMQPMRSIPSQVICLIGMNEDEFPRQDKNISFDLISSDTKICDKSKRHEDRYIFLEALLSARKVFYLSYLGKNNKTNEEIAPAMPVSELMDYISEFYGEDTKNYVFVDHKLHGFNEEYFKENNNKLITYSREELEAAKSLRSFNEFPKNHLLYKENLLSSSSEFEEISIQDFISFFKNPCRELLTKKAEISLPSEEIEAELDNEPFDLNALDSYLLKEEILESILENKPSEFLYNKKKLEGVLPVGDTGKIVFENQSKFLDEYSKTVFSKIEEFRNYTSLSELYKYAKNKNFQFRISDTIFHGALNNLFEINGNNIQIIIELGSKNGRRIIESWIKHLFLVASGSGNYTWMFFKGKNNVDTHYFPSLSIEKAHEIIKELLEVYKTGMERPIPFFPKSSYQYCEKQDWNKVRTVFLGNEFSDSPPEQDKFIKLCFDETLLKNESLREEFEKFAQKIFSHPLHYMEKD